MSTSHPLEQSQSAMIASVTMGPKFLENDNEQIVTEYAVDRISKNIKGNTLENILDDMVEKQKSMAEEEIKRIKIKSNLQ